MPYVPVPRPASLSTRVHTAVERLERQYFHEVHVMLRLPIPRYRLTSNCTFSCAQMLVALIGGVSTVLYAHRDSKPGKDFKALLIDYFPWSDEPRTAVTPEEASNIIYHVFRNPLAHNLGLHVKPHPKTPLVKIKRAARPTGAGGLTEQMIERLEQISRPSKLSNSVVVRPSDATVLFIEQLYWGTRVMLSKLLLDTARMTKADAFLAKVT